MAVKTSDRVLAPDDGAEPVGHHRQRRVAGPIPETIVEAVDAVHVAVQHGNGGAVAPGRHEGMLDTIGKQDAVGQPRERVVECLVAQLVFERVPFGHVAGVEDDAVDGRHVEHVGHAGFGVAPRSIGVAQSALAYARRGGLGDHLAELAHDPFHIVGVDQHRKVGSQQGLRFVSEDQPDRRGLIGHEPVGRDDADDVAGALDQGLEPLRTLAGYGLLLKVDSGDGQGGLAGEGPDGPGQVVSEGIRRFDDNNPAGNPGDLDESEQNGAGKEARLLCPGRIGRRSRAGRRGGGVGGCRSGRLVDMGPERALIGQSLTRRGQLADFENSPRYLVGPVPGRADDAEYGRRTGRILSHGQADA